MKKHIPKYILVFFVTFAVFAIAWVLSAQINERKFANLKAEQDQVSIGILSSETEFDLLKEGTCDDNVGSVFAESLASLASKISYSEQNVATPQEIAALKKQYTLLEVRDFLLAKRAAERCKQSFTSILYFYGTSEGCPECVKQGYVLDALRQLDPQIRIYAFDYNLDLSTIKALVSIYNISDALPALVINGVTYQGFQSLADLKVLVSK